MSNDELAKQMQDAVREAAWAASRFARTMQDAVRLGHEAAQSFEEFEKWFPLLFEAPKDDAEKDSDNG